MKRYLDELFAALEAVSIMEKAGGRTPGLEEGMQVLLNLFLRIKESGKTLCFIGNGGSAAIAAHMTTDFFKNGGMKTISLFDASALTCFGNDWGYEYIFSKQVERVMDRGDLLVAVSSSGRSPNIINAISAAHERGAEVLSITGFSPDNPARLAADYSLYVPSGKYGIVESVHNLLLQALVDGLRAQEENPAVCPVL